MVAISQTINVWCQDTGGSQFRLLAISGAYGDIVYIAYRLYIAYCTNVPYVSSLGGP